MSELKTKLSGPDLAKGVAISTVADGASCSGTSTANRRSSHGGATSCSRSVTSARTMVLR